MVKIDPKNVRVTLPNAYLLAIGKVCAQWAVLEANVEFTLIKLAGMNHDDVRGKILVNHMSWPQKLDIMSALVDQLLPDYPRLNGYDTDVVPLLKKAQEGRNRIVHGFWSTADGTENGEVTLMRATARGKLKLHIDKMTIGQIEAVLQDIHNATAALWNKVIGS